MTSAGPADIHIHRSGPVFGLARSCWRLLGPNRFICIGVSGALDFGSGASSCLFDRRQRTPMQHCPILFSYCCSVGAAGEGVSSTGRSHHPGLSESVLRCRASGSLVGPARSATTLGSGLFFPRMEPSLSAMAERHHGVLLVGPLRPASFCKFWGNRPRPELIHIQRVAPRKGRYN